MLGALLLTVIPLCLTIVSANTEKVIFLGPDGVQISNARPNLQDLNIETISPSSSASSSLRLHLPVAFPSEVATKGIDSWYLLEDLQPGSRYEVRVCWAAIQPTDFWLTTHTISEVFDTPNLITSLASFSEARQAETAIEVKRSKSDRAAASKKSSVLFLQVSAAADFFTSNKTLMSQPPPVLIDLILDPYIFNIFPQSLLPTALYITIIAILSWFLSDYIYAWLNKIAQQDKAHTE